MMKTLISTVLTLTLFSSFAYSAEYDRECGEQLVIAAQGDADPAAQKLFNKLKKKITNRGLSILSASTDEPGSLNISKSDFKTINFEYAHEAYYRSGGLLDLNVSFEAKTKNGTIITGTADEFLLVDAKEVFKAGISQEKIECVFSSFNPHFEFFNPETKKRISSGFYRNTSVVTDALNIIGLRDQEGKTFKIVISK